MILNAHIHAHQSYASPSSIKSAKDTEIEIILEATRRLKSAHQSRGSDYATFAEAVRSNRKLWTILSTDVAHSENALPADLRARIFYLGEFVQQYSRTVLKDDASVGPLMDVNLAILRGLGTRPSAP